MAIQYYDIDDRPTFDQIKVYLLEVLNNKKV